MNLSYRVQEQAGGIAQALSLAENFAGSQPLLVALGDNIFEANLERYILEYEKQPGGARVFLKQVTDPWRYGIAEIKQERVISIEEKPSSPRSNLCVTGIYIFDQQVFTLIRALKPSDRGEMEITDLNNAYLERRLLSFSLLDGRWIDAGTFTAIRQANQLVTTMDIDFSKYFSF